MNKFTQVGTLSIAIMLPIFIFSIIMIFFTSSSDAYQAGVFVFIGLTFLICLLIFYKITILIDNQHVSFRMGIGLISRKYPVGDIKSCRAVKNSILTGVGIRLLPNGWLYNVSGSYAVELEFKNRKSVVRIGTDQPEKVAEEINKLINSSDLGITEFKKEVSGYYLTAIILFLVLFFPAILMIYGSREQKVITQKDELTIKGMYGLTLTYSSITEVDTIAFLPKIRRRTNGFALGSVLKGNFTLSDNNRVKLFIRRGISPYIHIKTREQIIYINFKDPENTLALYNDLLTRTNSISN